MTDTDPLAEIRQRRAAIGEGRWFAYEDTIRKEDETADSDWEQGSVEIGRMYTRADNEFAGHAPEDITWLLGEVERLRGLLQRLATETLLARAVIHELTWGQIPITEHPRLRATLQAWGEDDKTSTPELKRLAAETREER